MIIIKFNYLVIVFVIKDQNLVPTWIGFTPFPTSCLQKRVGL